MKCGSLTQVAEMGSVGGEAVFDDDDRQMGMLWRNSFSQRRVALRSQSFLALPSTLMIGSGASGITSL